MFGSTIRLFELARIKISVQLRERNIIKVVGNKRSMNILEQVKCYWPVDPLY